jgi:tRNA modification GTPase
MASLKMKSLMFHMPQRMSRVKDVWHRIGRPEFRRFHAQHRPYDSCQQLDRVDTIYALSSGIGAQTGVAVLRISGPYSWTVLESLCGGKDSVKDVKPRYVSLKSLHCPATKEKLDRALVLWFPGPKSFTGEDVVELHIHGSRAVISGLFSAIEHLDTSHPQLSVRPANRGEFTRRAFENGKMDLTEVEGLADLLAADTARQRQQALKQMDGHLRKSYERWRLVIRHHSNIMR